MTMKNILSIQKRKEDDQSKEEERQKRKAVLMAETGMTFEETQEEPEEEKEESKKTKKGKKAKEVEIDPEELERRKVEAAKKADIARYGRTWLWEDYLEDTDVVRKIWMDGSDAISRINPHVLEDIEDILIMDAFKGSKMTHEDIRRLVNSNLTVQRERAKMHQTQVEAEVVPDETTMTKYTAPVDIIEEGKIEDKRRTFMTPLRPHERIWNFEYDDEAKRPKHVLRPDADPAKCYIDGRVEKLVQKIRDLSAQLQTFTKDSWDRLNMHTLEIFKSFEKDEDTAYKTFMSTDNQ